MAADEEMAVNFYKIGNANDLAERLIAILQDSELQHSMAESNFAAGVRMTMDSVVRNYLRWFELNKCKREIRKAGVSPGRARLWLRALFSPTGETLQSASLAAVGDGADNHHGVDSAGNSCPPLELANSVVWRKSETSTNRLDGDGYRKRPALEQLSAPEEDYPFS